MKPEFEWDDANTKHVIHDHPERKNTLPEIESIFADPNRIIAFDRLDPYTEEKRYFAIGIGTEGVVKYVAFVVRNGKFRPITCYRAKKKQKASYYERIPKTPDQASSTGSQST